MQQFIALDFQKNNAKTKKSPALGCPMTLEIRVIESDQKECGQIMATRVP